MECFQSQIYHHASGHKVHTVIPHSVGTKFSRSQALNVSQMDPSATLGSVPSYLGVLPWLSALILPLADSELSKAGVGNTAIAAPHCASLLQ
jgi:hypothetical protein